MSRAIIFANGLLPDISSELLDGDTNPIRRLIGPADLLIAADGGTRHALSLGLTPSFIIGDLDSLTVDDRKWTNEKGVRLIQFSVDKNETDLELAIHFAVEQGCSEIVIVAALGGRLDQTLGNLSLLNAPELVAVDIRLDDGVEEVFLTRGTCKISGKPGDLVSLLPWGGDVTGVSTERLRWVLQSETLHQYKTRGISNELLGETASIKISSGSLLIVHRRSP